MHLLEYENKYVCVRARMRVHLYVQACVHVCAFACVRTLRSKIKICCVSKHTTH